MIEITQDGPFAQKADQLFPDRVRVIGLGHTGAAVCDQITLHGRAPQDLWVFDSDQQTIEGCVAANRQILGRALVHGLGCNGDLDLAREIVALEENRLAHIAHGCDILILVVGLAGATGVALAEHMISLGHQAGAKVIVVGAQPFSFEGWARREKSIRAIADLRREADSVLVFAHDRLAENAATIKNIRNGFYLMHQLLGQVAQALAQVVCKRGLIQLSFADVRSLYGRYSGSEILENCWAAHVDGDIDDCTGDLVARLLDSPFLSDESMWKHIDHAIVAVGGTRDLGLTDVQELVTAIKERLPVNIPIATSAALDDQSHDKVRVTLLFATTAPVHVPATDKPVFGQSRPPSHHKTQVIPLPAKEIAATSKNVPATVEANPVPPKPAPTLTDHAFPKPKPAPAVANFPLTPKALPSATEAMPVQPKVSRPIQAAPAPPKAPAAPAAIPRPTPAQPLKTQPAPRPATLAPLQKLGSVAGTTPPVTPPVKPQKAESSPAEPASVLPNKPKIAPFPVARPAYVAPAPPEPDPEPPADEMEEHAMETEEELYPSAMESGETLPEPEPEPVAARASRRLKAKQEEMQFEGPTRGRFEKSHETIYNGENLDQPTFRRRGLKIVV